MRKTIVAVAGWLILLAGAAGAQDAIMGSAETINRDNFKFSGYPIILFGEGDNKTGLGLRAGYGFSRGFDVEAKLSFFDGLTYYGADAEWWLHRRNPDFSFSLGAHRLSPKGGSDTLGIDTTPEASWHVGHKLELYGALRVAWEFPDGGDSYRRISLIPGIEYKISDDIDFEAEVGLKLNDNATNHFAVGIVYYIR
jgi:hypothetical protein